MTTLTRFVLRHALIGTAAAVLFVGLLLAFDVGRIGSLALVTEGGTLAVVVMTAFFSITFGSAQIGFALMFSCEGRDHGGGGRDTSPLRVTLAGLVPAPVRAARQRPPHRG